MGGERRRPRHPGPAWPPSTGFTLVHYSTRVRLRRHRSSPHTEDEPLSPLGVYAQTKAAGDVAVATAPRHYVAPHLVGHRRRARTSSAPCSRWPSSGVSPSVVDDQVGRLTFTDELARATRHLLDVGAAYGTYNVTNGGEPMSWARRSRRRSSSAPAAPPTTSPAVDAPRSTSPGKDLAPRPLQQRDGPREAPRHRLRARGRHGPRSSATSPGLTSTAG